MKKLVITHGEEKVDFDVVDEDAAGTKTTTHIVNLNYDDHGSRGMQDAGEALEDLATALGIEIEHRHEYAGDEDDGFGS